MKHAYFPKLRSNKHLQACTQYFGRLRESPAELPPETNFVFVCYTNRSGSNYLSALLASDGRYNLADENLNSEAVKRRCEKSGIDDFQKYFSFLANHVAKSNVLFLKLAVQHLEILGTAGILDQILDRSKFVFIERNDKLAQAISHVIAFATGRYTSLLTGSAPPEELEYSATEIDLALNKIVDANRQFDLFFGKNGIVPITVVYERLVSDPLGQTESVAHQLGLAEFRVDPSKVRLEQQSGTINAAWRNRFLTSGAQAEKA